MDVQKTIRRTLPGYTQGLIFHGGKIIESAGKYGESRIQQIDPATGEVNALTEIQPSLFAEGLDFWNGTFAMLTWKEHTILTWSGSMSSQPVTRAYPWEGWGLTHSPTHWVASDGSSRLRFLNAKTFRLEREVEVRQGSGAVAGLNELEWVDGQVLANIFQSDRMVRIHPETGCVSAVADLSPLRLLLGEGERKRIQSDSNAVINGIASDPSRDVLYVTGKTWPFIFEIKLKKQGSR